MYLTKSSKNSLNLGSPTFILDRFRKARFIAVFVGLSLFCQLGFPNVALALTSGPVSPDFSSFEPVATTNMVNDFTGQFVYNLPVLEIPGASGGGYALSLSYHSGDGPEADASWVGYGWSLNPGSINRAKRGIPDDFKGTNVRYYNNVPKNWTIAATGNFGLEGFSVTGTLSNTIRYNNYKGFGYTNGAGISVLNGAASLGYYITDGVGKFSVAVNPAALLSSALNMAKKNSQSSGVGATKNTTKTQKSGIGQSMKLSAYAFASSASSGIASKYISYLLTDMSSPYNMTPYSGQMMAGAFSLTGDPPPAPLGITGGIVISYVEQENVAQRDVPAYGYMYAGNALSNNTSDSECINDYTIEKPATFNKRDKYLPVPFSTPDAFFLSGEGIGGSFRMYNNRIGVNSPNFCESNASSNFFGLDIHLGDDVGVGGEGVLDGWQKLTIKSSWTNGNGNTDYFDFARYDNDSNTISEPVFFRFNNDLGGKVVYDSDPGTTDRPVQAEINGEPYIQTSLKLKGDRVPGNITRSGRSSYIGYHTNAEIKISTPSPNPKRGLAYERREVIHNLAGRNTSGTINNNIDDEIGEVTVYNEDGNNYVYGLPVYTAKEKNLQHGLTSVSGTYNNQYWVRGNIADNYKKVGEEYLLPYASSYLLTQITTPDYVDINLNGPDDADFGGYTRFSYDRVYGSDDKSSNTNWYKWRAPYTGVYYNPMRLSDDQDNMGSLQSGYKEVYYLDTIETKTHFAVFSTSARNDGLDASASDEQAAQTGAVGTNHTKKLDKIDLYAKGPGGQAKLVKTVHFEYDYTCWPNNENTTGSSPKGKLTLKRVFFEYNGVLSFKISPYKFDYVYPTSSSVSYPAKYSSILNYSAGLNQQPEYQATGSNTISGRYIDCWGNYMYDGAGRRNVLQSWLDQTPPSSFDPAAWQLKRITLPSGGEIHVQYEQNTYANVQDRPACAMVSLAPNTNPWDQDKFYLNLSDLDIPSADYSRLASLIENYYKPVDNKIYFKFLYTLVGNHAQNIGDCNADYIDGYATVQSAGIDANGLYIQIDPSDIPRDVCKDYVKKEVAGNLKDGNCLPTGTQPMSPPDLSSLDGWGDVGQQLWSATKAAFLTNLTCCKHVNEQNSYLRIPIWNKKGGGIRVKRLLMYNKGIDANDPTLYGTEYIYQNELTNESFGVATNEPYENNEENPLVKNLDKRDAQSSSSELLAGKEKDEFEGPLGMYSIPAASVGYSEVIKKNIHQTRATGGGYTVLNYYTVKDYPFDRQYPELGGAEGNKAETIQSVVDDMDIDIGLFSYTINSGIRSSQGYCFIQNQMHGQLHSIADYPGMYDKNVFFGSSNPPIPVAQTTYDYFEPGEKIPVFEPNSYAVYYDQPGREMDMTIDRRSVADEAHETRITGDVTVGILGIVELFYGIAFPITSESNVRLNTIVTTKVEHYPAIIRSISVMKDGYVQKTDNLAFDQLTCKAVVTRSYDGYNGLDEGGTPHAGTYTNYDIMASSQYLQMGEKSWSERHCYFAPTGVTGIAGSGGAVTFSGVNISSVFQPGDLIAMHTSTSGVSVGNVVSISSGDITVKPAIRYNASLSTSTAYTKFEIVKSAFTNQLHSSAGGMITYGEGVLMPGIQQLFSDLNVALVSIINCSGPCSTTVDMTYYAASIGIGGISSLPNCYKRAVSMEIKKAITCPTVSPCYTLTIVFDDASTFSLDITWFVNWVGGPPAPPSGFAWTYIWGVGSVPMLGLYNQNAQTIYNTSILMDYLVECPPFIHRDVLKASVTTYDDNWAIPAPFSAAVTGLNPYESGALGRWRPDSTLVYRMPTVNGTNLTAGERNFNKAGTAPITLQKWVYTPYLDFTRWIITNDVSTYEPSGNAVEENDALGVFSAARYGYKGILPTTVAQNVKYNSMRFESFENIYTSGSTTTVEDGVLVDATKIVSGDAHTGYASYTLGAQDKIIFSGVGEAAPKHFIRFWVKTKSATCPLYAKMTYVSSTYTLTVNPISRTGEWTLFEAIAPSPVIAPNTATYEIGNASTGPGPDVQIDDIKIQVWESKMTTYVYDTKTYKLSAALDDQHFATYYQYDGEGKLTRKLMETILGVKTAQEANYHTPRVQR